MGDKKIKKRKEGIKRKERRRKEGGERLWNMMW